MNVPNWNRKCIPIIWLSPPHQSLQFTVYRQTHLDLAYNEGHLHAFRYLHFWIFILNTKTQFEALLLISCKNICVNTRLNASSNNEIYTISLVQAPTAVSCYRWAQFFLVMEQNNLHYTFFNTTQEKYTCLHFSAM